MVMRLDIKFRVDPTVTGMTARYDVGGGGDTGDTAVTLTTGLYNSLALLCAEVQTQLQTVDGAFTCTESGGVVTIAADELINLTLPASLAAWLGLSTSLSGAMSYTGTASPGTFVASFPWDSDRPLGWEVTLKRWSGDYQTGGAIKMGKIAIWHISPHVTQDELSQFRGVVSYLASGLPARWWRDTTVSTAFSISSNWFGYVDVKMSPAQREYADQWLSPGLQNRMAVDLEFITDV